MSDTHDRPARHGAALFGVFAAGFVVSALVELAGGHDTGPRVLGYAASPVPFLLIGALACRRVAAATYERWMLAFGALLLLWMVCSGTAMATSESDQTFRVLVHMLVAGAGAVNVLFIRAAARQRGLAR